MPTSGYVPDVMMGKSTNAGSYNSSCCKTDQEHKFWIMMVLFDNNNFQILSPIIQWCRITDEYFSERQRFATPCKLALSVQTPPLSCEINLDVFQRYASLNLPILCSQDYDVTRIWANQMAKSSFVSVKTEIFCTSMVLFSVMLQLRVVVIAVCFLVGCAFCQKQFSKICLKNYARGENGLY